MSLRWERCRGNSYAGYDGDDFVALLKPVVVEREGRDDCAGARVYEEAWKWHLLDEHGNPVEFGDEPTLKQAKQEAEAAYRAAEELLR